MRFTHCCYHSQTLQGIAIEVSGKQVVDGHTDIVQQVLESVQIYNNNGVDAIQGIHDAILTISVKAAELILGALTRHVTHLINLGACLV